MPVRAAKTTKRRPKTLEEAAAWLNSASRRMIHDCRRDMTDPKIDAFPPQVGCYYEAFWLRDYAYMLEGCADAFTDKQLLDACRLFLDKAAADGSGVDCVKFDGTAIYKPGYGTMGENPVADGGPFTVNVAYLTWKQTRRGRTPCQGDACQTGTDAGRRAVESENRSGADRPREGVGTAAPTVSPTPFEKKGTFSSVRY